MYTWKTAAPLQKDMDSGACIPGACATKRTSIPGGILSKGPDFRDLYSRGHALQKGPGFRKKSPRDALSIPGALRPPSPAAENINRTSAKSQRFRTMRTAPYMPASFPSPASLIPASRQAWKAAGL